MARLQLCASDDPATAGDVIVVFLPYRLMAPDQSWARGWSASDFTPSDETGVSGLDPPRRPISVTWCRSGSLCSSAPALLESLGAQQKAGALAILVGQMIASLLAFP
mgnify:CR=1 FL=1